MGIFIRTLGEAKYYHCGQEFSEENEICKKCEEYRYCSACRKNKDDNNDDDDLPF